MAASGKTFLNIPCDVDIMKDGDFVQVDYVGRVKGTNDIFDLTNEDVAKKENVYNPKITYKPVTLIVGGGFILRGLDEALKDMKVGERKTFEVAPDKAFGDRRDDMVKPLPLARFKEQNIDPFPGAVVNSRRAARPHHQRGRRASEGRLQPSACGEDARV